LFSDKRLSIDGTMSCASCHIPDQNFTDTRPTAVGLHGQVLTRHTPSLLNVRYAVNLFRDGRAVDLEAQIRAPLLSRAEHGLTDGEFHASPLGLPASTLANLSRVAGTITHLRHSGQLDALNALITMDRDVAALGRFTVTLDPKDIGQFKTPSLRNVARTGPYMHDGSVASLPEAVDLELYSRSAHNYPLVLTEDERADLLAFLQALSSP
jgi:cytochrome c peroxidase